MEKRVKMSDQLKAMFRELSNMESGLEIALIRVGESRRQTWEASRRECQASEDARIIINTELDELSWEE